MEKDALISARLRAFVSFWRVYMYSPDVYGTPTVFPTRVTSGAPHLSKAGVCHQGMAKGLCGVPRAVSVSAGPVLRLLVDGQSSHVLLQGTGGGAGGAP